MDIEILKFTFQVIQFLLTAGVAFYVYMSNKDKVTNDRINVLQTDIDEKLDDHTERIATLEAVARNAPNHSNLGSLHEKINAVGSDVSSLGGRMDGIESTLRQLTNLIMQKGLK